MNFKGHLTGGIITSSVVTYGCYHFKPFFEENNITQPQLPIILGVCLFFSLFPDLDISSTPQKWFYRIIFCVIFYLYFVLNRIHDAVFLSLISFTPLLHKHRGWTHYTISAIVLPLICIVLYHYKSTSILEVSKDLILYSVACTIGWFTHLILDSKLVKKIS